MDSDDPLATPIEPSDGSADRDVQPGHPAGADAPVSGGEVLDDRSWRPGGAIDDADDERDIRTERSDDEDESAGG